LKVALVCRDKDVVSKYFSKFNFVKSLKPDVVIVFGGEGTLLFAEQKYPSIPKLFIYNGSECRRKYSSVDFYDIFSKLSEKKYEILDFLKLEAKFKGKKYVALNDFNVHYKLPCALRFLVKVDGKELYPDFLGDGVVISTPYGSSGYYSSITRNGFDNGIGLAFNNVSDERKCLIVPEISTVEVNIIRGPGQFSFDTCKKIVSLNNLDKIIIKRAKQSARLIKLNGYGLKINKCVKGGVM